ncbi:MAG: hypothetical protein K6B74_01850 [Ruminococcus sp.]|nr:hypothetical protein [Ruminococcus sp.]
MKKQMIVIAMMSMIVTLAGCAEANDISSITKNSPADSVTVTESTAAKEADTVSSESEKAAESKPEEKKETAENKPEEKKETPETKPEEIKETATGKRVAAPDVTEIIGEWVEMGSGEARFVTVNSDGSFEAFSNYETLASGYVTVDTAGGVKKYSFNDENNGLWYTPFIYSCDNGFEMIAGEDYPAIGAVAFCRKEEERTPSPVFEAIAGKWYEEDADIGRTIEVTSSGTYSVYSDNVGISAGTISAESSDGLTYYTFTDTDRNIWYTFRFSNNSFPELISVNDRVSFSRESSSVRASEGISKIVGTWYPDDPSYPTLVVNDDGSYAMLADDGSAEKTNIVKVEIRNGVEKYTFKDDTLGTWLVPFEVRNGGSVLVTEDNPVFGIISFHR